MRFTSGYIMLPRDLRCMYFHGDWAGHALLTYFIENMEWDKEGVSIFGVGRFKTEVKFAQFASTKGQICADLGIKRGSLSTHLAKLKRMGMVSEKSMSKYSIFNVNQELAEAISEQRRNKDETNPTAYKETRKKNIFRVSKDTLVKSPRNSSLKISEKSIDPDQLTSENKSDAREDRKNIPPFDERGTGGALTPSDLFRLWNDRCGSLSKVRDLSPKRIKAAKLILKRISNPEDWITIIDAVTQSPFHRGENDRGWKANFDFVIKDSGNIISRALEGSLKTVRKDRLNSHVRDIEIPY